MNGLMALGHDPEKACPALDAGCEAVFRKIMPNKKLKRDDIAL
jgi:hypothetical protein